jgi:hypothetical protein
MLMSVLMLVLVTVHAQDDGSPDNPAPIGRGREKGPITGLVYVDAADVRVGPDFAYDAIGQLPHNAAVTVVGRAGDFYYSWDGRQWLQIQFGDRIAWVYARLIRTSALFNDIPPTGRILPRNNDGRVPPEFDLSSSVCDQWGNNFGQSGNFMAGDTKLTVTYSGLQGANAYSVIILSPTGFRSAFDSTTTTTDIPLDQLPAEKGVYTWRVAPYWTRSTQRYAWQQVCLLRTGGTFEKPQTGHGAKTDSGKGKS